MGLPADQLGSGERVVIETREHWKHLLGAGLLCLLAVAGLTLVLLISPDEGFFAWLRTLGWLAFVVVVLVVGVWPYLSWLTRSYTLTTERLATRSGVLTRRGRDIPLDRVNDVAFEQGILDRMVRAGTLKVSAASEYGIVVLRDIPQVHGFVLTMNSLIKDARDDDRGRHASR